MKKIILLALVTLMMGACTEKDSNGHIAIDTGSNSNPETLIIDSCEYVKWGHSLSHKGNCRFCAERRKQELELLVEQLNGK